MVGSTSDVGIMEPEADVRESGMGPDVEVEALVVRTAEVDAANLSISIRLDFQSSIRQI